ncbi:ANK1 [Symbiodinium sp. CCMP2592]|nr:ANK1 [Symbiodinium sp. CCMP2592]
MAALMQADARHTQLLLEARADPNGISRSSLAEALTLPLRIKYRLGIQDPVAMPFIAGLGGTALHIAATTGCFEQAKLLLQFRAFHSCRHEMLTDLTPIQLAKDVQDENMTALLLLAAAGRDLEDSEIDDMDSLCI